MKVKTIKYLVKHEEKKIFKFYRYTLYIIDYTYIYHHYDNIFAIIYLNFRQSYRDLLFLYIFCVYNSYRKRVDINND